MQYSVYAKAYSAIRKWKYYASASLIVMAKSRARGIRMVYVCTRVAVYEYAGNETLSTYISV